MSESINERGAGRKKKFTVPTKSKTFRYPTVCEDAIIKAIDKITKPYSNEFQRSKNKRNLDGERKTT